MFKNEKGFGVITILLIIVVMGLIGCFGYYVYQAQQNNTHQTKVPTTANTEQVLVKFTDPTNLYTINYPKSWTIKNLGASEIKYGGEALKSQSIIINYPGGPKDFSPVYISSDKTPTQAQQTLQAWEAGSKDEPYSTTKINGYTTLHRHIEEAITRDDDYLIIKADQSSVLFSITSRMTSPHKGDVNFDATDKLTDFTTIVNSTKFLR